jgi:precorrin isomerase
LQSDAAPNPQLVVGITWGVDAMNAAKQPIQDRVLKEMQLEGVLGGTDV